MGDQLDSVRSQSHAAYFNDSFASNRRSSSGSFASKEAWKLNNLDKEALMGVIEEDKDDTNDKDLSELALDRKGINTHIEEIPKNMRKSRIMYGFLKKAGRGKIGIPHKRWCFLISPRPLNIDEYLKDSEQITEDILPPLIDFDTLYYYEMHSKDDTSPCKGSIKCIEVDRIDMKTEKGWHVIMIDAGPKKYELMSTTKYVVQQWIEAIELAKRTASERLYSITGSIKNISMIVTEFEMDSHLLSENLKKEAEQIFPKDKNWASIDDLLEDCSKLSKEFFSIFDACLVQKPPRKDVIKLYMDTQHTIMCDALSRTWEENALKYNLIEIMSF